MTNFAPIFDVPKLAIDTQLFAGEQQNARHRLERRIAWNLLEFMRQNGWTVARTYDGEAWEKPKSSLETMELIFNLDEISVRFHRSPHGKEHGILLVLGNGEDLICDWNYTEGDFDGFNALVEKFCDNLEAML